jgi:hypothetical protein
MKDKPKMVMTYMKFMLRGEGGYMKSTSSLMKCV